MAKTFHGGRDEGLKKLWFEKETENGMDLKRETERGGSDPLFVNP